VRRQRRRCRAFRTYLEHEHSDVGRIALDRDTLIVAADDLRIMIYTAEPETEDAERLSLAIVIDKQAFVD
jgi:hypothetical protein